MRAIWSGAIGFGLVNIPVKLFSATQGSELNLDMLDKKDHANIKFQRVNAESGKVVEWKNIIKGYMLNGKYVILDEDDFAKASPEKSKIISIEEFVNGKDIDSIYYETPYYLAPDKSGEKAYALLREALEKSGKYGLGTYVLRNREHLCVLKPLKNAIVLNTIRFAEEIRDVGELNIPAGKEVKPAELKMALSLIDQLTEKFDISKYKDSYTDSLLKVIRAKAKGKKTEVPQLRIVHSNARDLMSQLKASLGKKAAPPKKTKKAS
ncbi:non-homologous end joining protein Ku [Flavitalea antarctica]|jgi:DNA end-binding protein Ku